MSTYPNIIAAKDARIAELEAENERLRNMLNGYGKIDAELAIAERRIEALSRTGAVKVKALEWEETHSRRSDEDPTTEWNGGFEADSALGYYEISIGLGSDAYYWAVTNPLGDDVGSDFEDPSYAKAAAQADYERRILSALEPAAPEGQQDPVAWGEFYEGKIVAVSLHKSHHYTVPLYTRPAEQAVTEASRAMLEAIDAELDTDSRSAAFLGRVSRLRAALKAAMEAGR